jgi:hypothetical protein
MVAADGKTATRVFAFGSQVDGSPATDEVVLSTDRPGAGTFTHPQVTLGSLGAETDFVPCDQTTPGCTGPLSLTLALTSAPTVPIAHVATQLVAPVLLDPARQCLTGGNILYISGNDSIWNGTLTITDATWSQIDYSDLVELDVVPSNPQQGTEWKLNFGVQTFGGELTPDFYPHAQRWWPVYGLMAPLQPAMLITGSGQTCDTVTGSFTVDTYTSSNSGPNPVTIAFEQHCNGSTTTGLTGCLHWAP